MLYGEIIAVITLIHTKHSNTLCGLRAFQCRRSFCSKPFCLYLLDVTAVNQCRCHRRRLRALTAIRQRKVTT